MVGLDPRDFNTSALQPSLRDGALCIATQALRAWLRSCCPSGTKTIRPSKGPAFKLAPMGFNRVYTHFVGRNKVSLDGVNEYRLAYATLRRC
jgi:hypothetical protein